MSECDHLIARIAELESYISRPDKIEAILMEIESWYPEDVFPPPEPVRWEGTKQIVPEASRDQVSAYMARHIVKIIRQRLAE